MEFPVDIVIPWLNPTSKWEAEYNKYRGHENPGRVRDLGTFKYLLRSIEVNVPWVNKIFILLYDEEQKPAWLTESSKIRIVYHKDFIPESYLPNFNSLVTDMHICFIKDLSEHFIFINDDMFFMQKIPRNMYFTGDSKPVHQKSLHYGHFIKYNHAQFRYIEENMYNFVNGIVQAPLLWQTYHLPIPFLKSFQQYIWYKYGDKIAEKLSNSHIRANKNICNWVFYGLEEILSLCHFDNIYTKYPCTCFDLCDGMTNIEGRIKNKYVACLNDGDFLTKDFNKVKTDIIKIMNKKFPTPASFEL